MNEAALAALRDVDLVLLVLDRDRLTDAEDRLIEAVRRSGARAWLVINKVDRLQARELDKGQWSRLASVMDVCERTWEISAKHGHGLDDLVEGILSVMPSGPMMFPEEMTTDQPLSMQISEAIREKLVRQLGDELPYETAVVVEQIGDEEGVLHVDAVIYVERDAQKGIVIGRQGTRLKKIGQDARHDIEKMTGQKVMLNLWVKIKSNWSDDLKSLRGFGYDDRDI
jgi:GTP-binding protein Era